MNNFPDTIIKQLTITLTIKGLNARPSFLPGRYAQVVLTD